MIAGCDLLNRLLFTIPFVVTVVGGYGLTIVVVITHIARSRLLPDLCRLDLLDAVWFDVTITLLTIAGCCCCGWLMPHVDL